MEDYKVKWESLWEIHKENYAELQQVKATADRRLKLLREAKKVIYYISARQMVDDDTVNEFLERVEKELADAEKES